MICDEDPLRRRPRGIDGKEKATGEVCLDDDKFGQMGSQQRPNHQIRAVGWPQSKISSIGGGV